MAVIGAGAVWYYNTNINPGYISAMIHQGMKGSDPYGPNKQLEQEKKLRQYRRKTAEDDMLPSDYNRKNMITTSVVTPYLTQDTNGIRNPKRINTSSDRKKEEETGISNFLSR